MNKIFKSSEEAVSMFLGLIIVLVVVGLIFNFFQKRRGSISLPGVSDQKQAATVGLPSTAPTAAQTDKNVYLVKRGDSLWKIAQAQLGSGYKWVDIARVNNLKVTGLEVGQKLSMPQQTAAIIAPTKTTAVINSDTYVVTRGDSLWKIAVQKYIDGYQWTKIWQTNKNKLIDPNKLEIGMTLNLPKLK